jgi:tudor domain-containing protein 1/4/6/7
LKTNLLPFYIGVTPKHIDWTLEDAVRFRELIVNKRFVSVIKAVRQDEICANEICASMQLIDVSGDDDVYLNNVLIDEGRAKPFLDDIMLNSE